MGVPKLFHSLIQQYHHNDVSNPTGYYIIRRDIDNGLPIHLYFDFNSAIYQVLKPEIKTEEVLITHVVAYLDSLCNAVGRDRCALVYIALDGVPPMGKIHQQRIRRFHSICRSNRLKKINEMHGGIEGAGAGASASAGASVGEIDTNMITPGTAFMHSLGLAIKKYILERVASDGGTGKTKYIFSDSSIPGEGEHKLIHHIRQGIRLGVDGNQEERVLYGIEHNTVIYALDNDLIMLALTLGLENLFLFRESSEYGAFAMIHEGRRYLYMDIAELEEALIQNFRESYGCAKIEGREAKRRYIDDYVFLGMLLGNDFMPKTHWFSIAEGGYERLLSAYWQIHNHTEAYMVDSDAMVINTEMLCDMMYLIKEGEQEAIEGLFTKRRRAKVRVRNDATERERQVLIMDFYPLQHLHVEQSIDPWRAGWRDRYYRVCFNIDGSRGENIEMITQAYLKTLVWNFHYYFGSSVDANSNGGCGGCISWDWAYTFPYAPSWHDIYNELVKHKNINIGSSDKLFKFGKSKPVDSQTLLVMVLPWASRRFMASGIVRKLERDDSASGMRIYFPKKYGLNVAFHRFYHECTPIIYKMDLAKVGRFVSGCKLGEEELKRNLVGSVFIA
jgi:5'-3' exonuclease